MNGCARLRSHSVTSVSARPSVVTSVVATARSATAASTSASAKRRDVERERRRRVAGALIAVGGEQRLARRGGQRRIHLAHVHAAEPRDVSAT